MTGYLKYDRSHPDPIDRRAEVYTPQSLLKKAGTETIANPLLCGGPGISKMQIGVDFKVADDQPSIHI